MKEKALFAEAYDHDIRDVNSPTLSLKYRIGISYPWKLILPDTSNLPNEPIELFNISTDPTELQNLVETQPEAVKQLTDQINAWWLPDHLAR